MKRYLPLVLAVTALACTSCGGSDATSAAPGSSTVASGPASTVATTSGSDDSGGSDDSAAGAGSAGVVCTALRATLKGLKGQDAAAAAYQAQLVLQLSGSSIPPAELSTAVADPAIATTCPDDLKDFLEKAGVASLSAL